MTARPEQRRRRTLVGAAIATVLVLLAAGLTAVGANAVINSTEGEAVEGDARPVVALPTTDNAALAVVDGDNRLTSLIVATLLPSGQGGSIVTIPVEADASVGFGETRQPLDGQLDPADPAGFFQQVEATLAITLQFGEIIGADRLAELLGPALPVAVDLPVDVIDSSESVTDVVAEAGEEQLDGQAVAEVLQSIDDDANERTQHSIDVATWTGVAESSPADGAAEIPLDDVGRPVTSSTIDELFARLWSGPVQARDIQLMSPRPIGSNSAVVLDRRDVVLVFAQVSPARVSTPNPGPVFRLEIPISNAQLDAADSTLTSRREVGLNLIGQLFFLQANVASVDATPNPDGAPVVTRIEVANADFIATMEDLGPQLFGEVEVVLADELIDGIDVVVRLGTGYLVAEAAKAAADETAVPGTDATESNASTPDTAGTVDTDG
jgi:hypothetical protein